MSTTTMMLPVTPEPSPPTPAQLKFVPCLHLTGSSSNSSSNGNTNTNTTPIWWPAVVYDNPGHAMQERHADISGSIKAHLAIQLMTHNNQGAVANLLGFPPDDDEITDTIASNWILQVPDQRSIYLFLPTAVFSTTEQHLQTQKLKSAWKAALLQMQRILLGKPNCLVPRGTNLYPTVQEQKRSKQAPYCPKRPLTSTTTLVTKRHDQGRIWGREAPSSATEPLKRSATVVAPTANKRKKIVPSRVSLASRRSSSSPAAAASVASSVNRRSAQSRTNFYVWSILWPYLQDEGWTIKKASNPLLNWYYIPKGVHCSSSQLGVDYFASTEDVLAWAKSVDYRTRVGVATTDYESSSEEEDVSGTDEESSQFSSASSVDTDVSGLTQKAPTFAHIWSQLEAQGWSFVPAKDYFENDVNTWYWVRPGVNLLSDDAHINVDYFAKPTHAMAWLMEQEHPILLQNNCSDSIAPAQPTPERRTQPQDPGKPLCSASSASSDESDGMTRFQWNTLWRRLKEFGWTSCNAGKYNKLHSHYYIRPGKTVSTGTLGVDYFLSDKDVIQYEMEQEGVAVPTTSTTIETKRKRRVTLSPPVKKIAAKKAKKSRKKQPVVVKTAAPKKILPKTEWYQLQQIPSFTSHENIWKTLRVKLDFRHAGGAYCLPKAHQGKHPPFPLDHDMRKFLCQYGIPNIDHALTDEERTDLLRWTTFANVPVKTSTSMLKLANVPVLNPDEAMALLVKLNFSALDDGKYHHKPTEQTFASMTAMRTFVRGMPALVVSNKRNTTVPLDDDQVLSLRLWAALSPEPLPVFGSM
jgi:hypothetical protein